MDWLKPLLLMFYAPARGMALARERAPLGQAALLALLLSVGHTLVSQWGELVGLAARFGAWAALGVLFTSAGFVLLVGLVYVPLAIFFANLFERRASYMLALRQEYSAAASTAFYAFAAASLLALPLAYISVRTGLQASVLQGAEAAREVMRNASPQGLSDTELLFVTSLFPRIIAWLLIQPLTLFGLWAVVAVREVFRLAWWKAALVTVLSVVLMFAATPLLYVFSTLLASPFILLLVFFVVRSYVVEAQRTQRSRASFRQNLEAATLNPADASAHYNLGLLHQQRKEYGEARARFLRAVEIDPEETDAHYQLGRIARAEGRLPEAVEHFGQVVSRDDAHAQHEIWREVGATYLAAGQFADARDALERFLDRRQSDPEGLYLMGRAAAGLGDLRAARDWMTACVEAVRTAPAYKYRDDKRWLNEAQQFLRAQS
jgi:tetratricopeptide (TPR) repeat protein